MHGAVIPDNKINEHKNKAAHYGKAYKKAVIKGVKAVLPVFGKAFYNNAGYQHREH